VHTSFSLTLIRLRGGAVSYRPHLQLSLHLSRPPRARRSAEHMQVSEQAACLRPGANHAARGGGQESGWAHEVVGNPVRCALVTQLEAGRHANPCEFLAETIVGAQL